MTDGVRLLPLQLLLDVQIDDIIFRQMTPCDPFILPNIIPASIISDHSGVGATLGATTVISQFLFILFPRRIMGTHQHKWHRCDRLQRYPQREHRYSSPFQLTIPHCILLMHSQCSMQHCECAVASIRDASDL